jgi:large subunit ribosomal protein L38
MMEAAARKNTLEVSLEDVQKDWYSGQGLKHLKTVGSHFGLYHDVYGMTFEPQETMEISFESGRSVHYGNRIPPADMSTAPDVKLPQSDCYLTLTMTTPDGHLSDPSKEVLHWMRVNICPGHPRESREVCPYLQPLPPRGAGLLRYVFTLYSHLNPIRQPHVPEGNWLESRTFCSKQFMKENKEVTPVAFSFLQSEWDPSVHTTFMNILRCPEPVYQLVMK